MKWLCRIIGHGATTIMSDHLSNYVGNGMWEWPGVVTICPRCGLVWKQANDDNPRPPYFGERTGLRVNGDEAARMLGLKE